MLQAPGWVVQTQTRRSPPRLHYEPSLPHSGIMWEKLKEQLPAVIVTLVLIGGVAYWLHTQTVAQMKSAQTSEIADLRDATQAELRAVADATRAQIDAINRLLVDSIENRSSDLFLTDAEVAAANDQRLDVIAEAIADKIQPYDALPRTPEEAERQEVAQIDRVSSRLADRIQPVLSELSDDTEAARAAMEKISSEISDQMALVLTAELAKNQQLNDRLLESQAVARDTMILAQEASALYVSSFENSGVLTRILTLPAYVLKDASKGSIISSAERAKLEENLANKMAELQRRLNELDVELSDPVE